MRPWNVFFGILSIDSSLLAVLSDFYVSVITVFNQINYFRGMSELYSSLTDLYIPVNTQSTLLENAVLHVVRNQKVGKFMLESSIPSWLVTN